MRRLSTGRSGRWRFCHIGLMTADALRPTRLADSFTWADAMASGLTRRQADRYAGMRVARGLYGVDDTSRLAAVLGRAGPEAVLCGVTALRLAGVDLPGRLARDTRIWIQVPRRQSWPDRPQVRLVRSDMVYPRRMIAGLPCLQLAYCWLQLANEASVDEMVELADALTRRQRPITTHRMLTEILESSMGRRGLAKARQALALSVEGTDSIPETDMRLLLVRAGLPKPSVNPLVSAGPGSRRFRLDVAYEEKMVGAEYDGAYHGDPQQMQKDIVRLRMLEDWGWRIIRASSADLYGPNPGVIVDSVRKALARVRF